MTTTYDIEELEREFRRFWNVGQIREDWDGWADSFTEDVVYLERVYGTIEGRENVRKWIKPVMSKYREIYAVYEWHTVDPSGRVVFYMQNRRDHPSGKGYIDFPGISIIQYAGNGLWSLEEDYWAESLGKKAYFEYEAALKEFDPDHRKKATRLNWGKGPDWAIGHATFWNSGRTPENV